ncbi:MAG: hypothetical protein M0P31_03970 [Solirubrobacteraceae bacterium]|nr:hypothetical protein [Solirubrobacteraceae bacterium]
MRDARRATPALDRVARDVGPFARAAEPVTARLASSLRRATPVLRGAAPQLALLQRGIEAIAPVMEPTARVARSLEDNGVPQRLLVFVHQVALATARFDRTSHILPARLNLNQCIIVATVAQPECSSRFGDAGTIRTSRPRAALRRLTEQAPR